MSVTAEEIDDRLAALRVAGAKLRRRPRAEVIEVLGAVLDGWRTADTPWRQGLESELPDATGFSPVLIREGLTRALDGWTGKALRELVVRELGPLDEKHRDGAPIATGFETTAVFLAGSIPMPTLLSLIAPLVLRSPVLAKAASRDPVTPVWVARSIAETDAELGRCIEIVNFDRSDDACTQAFLRADCISVLGSDATVATLRERVRPPRRWVADGHRFSVAAVVPPAQARALRDVAERLAIDIALWDQLGCLSPTSVFSVGCDPAAAQPFAEALAIAMEETEKRWPRVAIDAAASHDIAHERSEAELRAAAGRSVVIHASDSTAWTVVCEDDPTPRPAPLHRFVRVVPVRDARGLIDALRPAGVHLAAVAIEGFGDQTSEVAHALAELGASRICSPGTLQSPPLAWRHAGRGVLLPLARLSDIEVPEKS